MARPIVSKWIPTATMMLVSLISYVDRSTLALLAPTILKETGLSNQQYGFITSAFSFAYMIGSPLWGMFLDRIGLRKGMTLAVALWTAASTLHAFAGGLFSFGIARMFLGFGEGATFPGGLRTAVQTLPATDRAKGIAISYSGGSLGAVVTPFLITPIALWWGWRGAFWFTGLIGAAWILWWRILSRRADIQAFVTPPAGAQAPLNWRDPRLYAFMACYGLAGSPLAFVLYNSSLYFAQAMGKSQLDIGKVLWIPPLAWELGYYFWGWRTDRLAQTDSGFHTAIRGQVMLLTACMTALIAVPHLGSYAGALATMAFCMFIGGGFITTAMAYVSRVFASTRAGLVAGIGVGSWSATVALLAPVFGGFFDRKDYSGAFALAVVPTFLGCCCFLLLSRRQPGR